MPQERPLQDSFDVVRIPVCGEEMGPAKSLKTGNNATNYPNQLFVNCFPANVSNPTTGQQEVWLESREGMICTTSIGTLVGNVTAPSSCVPLAALSMTTLAGLYLVAWLDTSVNIVYLVGYNPGGVTVQVGFFVVGTYTHSPQQPNIALTEIVVAGVPGVAVSRYDDPTSANNGVGYYAMTAAGVWVGASMFPIADVDFPVNLGTPDKIVGGFVQMNGTTYIQGRSGKIYNSDLNSITSWNALGVKEATSYPDRGLGLLRYKHHIIAFGEQTIEFFNDAGTPAPASPLQRTDQAFIKMGAYSPTAYINFNDTVYWLSNSENGRIGLFKLEGYAPVEILSSAQAIEMGSQGSPRFQIILLNNQAHLVTNTVKRLQIPGSAAMNVDDDHPFIAAPYGIMCVNLQNNTVWWLAPDQDVLSSPSFAGILCVGENEYPSQRYVFWQFEDAVGLGFNQNPASFQVYSSQSNSWDSLILGPSGIAVTTNLKIPVYFNTTPMDFGNERRKRVHKIKLIAQHYEFRIWATSVSAPSTTWRADNNYLYFYISKTDSMINPETGVTFNTPGDILTRSIDIAPQTNTARRYYVSNLGARRIWTLGFATKIWLPFRVRAIELDMSQGL